MKCPTCNIDMVHATEREDFYTTYPRWFKCPKCGIQIRPLETIVYRVEDSNGNLKGIFLDHTIAEDCATHIEGKVIRIETDIHLKSHWANLLETL